MFPLPSFFLHLLVKHQIFLERHFRGAALEEYKSDKGYLFEKVTRHRNSLANLFVLNMLNTVFKLLVFLTK